MGASALPAETLVSPMYMYPLTINRLVWIASWCEGATTLKRGRQAGRQAVHGGDEKMEKTIVLLWEEGRAIDARLERVCFTFGGRGRYTTQYIVFFFVFLALGHQVHGIRL